MPDTKRPLFIKRVFLLGVTILAGLNFMLFAFCPGSAKKDLHENRATATFPSFRSTPLEKFFPQAEKYFTDNFILKYAYISRLSALRKQVFNYSNPEIRVIAGKDGWMFYNSCHYADPGMDEFCGLKPLSEAELASIATTLQIAQRWCDLHGIVFIPLICPDKQSIYPEFLPSIYTSYRENCYDQMLAANPMLINLKKALLDAKPKTIFPLYYKTDTHWNKLGAFLAVSELSKAIHTKFPVSKVLNLADISISEQHTDTGMDLARMLVWTGPVDETELTIRFNKRAGTRVHKAFVFHDSFFDAMEPSVSQLFDTVQTRHSCFGPLQMQEILDAKPDVLIIEVVERSKALFVDQFRKPFTR